MWDAVQSEPPHADGPGAGRDERSAPRDAETAPAVRPAPARDTPLRLLVHVPRVQRVDHAGAPAGHDSLQPALPGSSCAAGSTSAGARSRCGTLFHARPPSEVLVGGAGLGRRRRRHRVLRRGRRGRRPGSRSSSRLPPAVRAPGSTGTSRCRCRGDRERGCRSASSSRRCRWRRSGRCRRAGRADVVAAAEVDRRRAAARPCWRRCRSAARRCRPRAEQAVVDDPHDDVGRGAVPAGEDRLPARSAR